MKKLILSVVLACCVMIPSVVFADAVAPVAPVVPDWVTSILAFLGGLPVVGHVLTVVLSWLGLAASILTVLSAAAVALFGLPQLIAKWAGAQSLADKIKAISDKVLPWLQYFSMFNVQKK